MVWRPLETQLVGSYSKPDWLLARERYPFTHEEEAWRPSPTVLKEAQDDATLLAIYDQEEAGLDIITDGEERRGRFDLYMLRYGGIDTVNLGQRDGVFDRDMSGSDVRPEVAAAWADPVRGLVPRIVGPVHWEHPLTVGDFRFLRAHTSRKTKMTVLGPLTSASRISNAYYEDLEPMVMDFSSTINQEILALEAAGADIVQIDEPDLFLRRARTSKLADAALRRTVEGVGIPVIVHICHGYPTSAFNKRVSPHYGEALAALASGPVAGISLEWEEPGYDSEILRACGDKIVVLGVLSLGSRQIETPEHVAARLREAINVVPPERLSPAPDCGLWHLPRDIAFGKIRAMALGTAIVRAELGV